MLLFFLYTNFFHGNIADQHITFYQLLMECLISTPNKDHYGGAYATVHFPDPDDLEFIWNRISGILALLLVVNVYDNFDDKLIMKI